MTMIARKWAYTGMLAFGLFMLPGGASATAWYGALAYNLQTGAWGWATRDTPDDAAEVAENNCSDADAQGNCQVVFEFANTCGAFAVDVHKATGWARGQTRRAAETAALRQCNSQSVDDTCRVKVWACSAQK